MAVGLPLKTTYANGDVYSASDVNDTNGTVNLVGQTSNFYAGKNKIINGKFDVWQRGTSFTPIANQVYSADRWFTNRNGTGATVTVSQQTFTPGTAPVAGYEGQYFFRFAQSVAGTGCTFNGIAQRIEDVRTLAGQAVTLSFWAKADASRSVDITLQQAFGSGGSGGVGVTNTVTFTTSWVRYTISATLGNLTGKTIGTGSYLEVFFDLPKNVTQTIDLWGVQLEAGSTATAFQTATGTIQGELAACQRYYFRKSASNAASLMYFGTGYAYATNAGDIQITLPVQMRVTPTAIDFSALGDFKWEGTTSANTPSAIGFDGNQNNPYAVSVNVTKTAGFTTWQAINFMANGTTNAYLGFSAEL
ncbi:Carbohydrate-binding, CenC-like [uncultured Caudovirales phage]|uniref:Carbohydrate-binding, CenC-like n=1 Tax=uncultured Caudovirales phage TaxID=2100421 RepID=A0A6J7X0U7_9CAUD|nr:Carbohydrate-binding, CenC-like [uncultured Caudovirales phage]